MDYSSSNEPIDVGQFISWKSHPITELLYSDLSKMRGFYIDSMLHTELTDLGVVGKHAGMINAIDYILNLDFKTLAGKED